MKTINPFTALAFLPLMLLSASAAGLADASLAPVRIVPPPARYRDPGFIRYQTGPSIAVAPKGRIWVAIMTGGRDECNLNYVDLLTSGDGGRTWSEPKLALDIDGPLRTFDPAMWTDPEGRVWLFWCQCYDFWDGRGGLWASVCENPDDENAAWSAPRRLCDGVMKDKPLVLANGDRWLFVEQWQDDTAHTWGKLSKLPRLPEWYHPDTPHIGANIYCSKDRGQSWNWLSTVPVPKDIRTCDEHMAVELKDGTFRMLLRVKTGMAESMSSDGGRTWTTAAPGAIRNPAGRFFFGRLRSGNILLVKNGPLDTQTDRRDLMAFLSEDDGRTFPYRLELDMRRGVAYPDVSEGADGLLHCVHDFDRRKIGEIVLDQFTEDDIRAGRIVSPKSRLHTIVRKNAVPSDGAKKPPRAGKTDDGAHAAIEAEIAKAAAENTALQDRLQDRCSVLDYTNLVRTVQGRRIWTDALQKALDEHEIVIVPGADEPYLVDRPLVIGGNRRLEAYGATVRLADGVKTLLLRTAAAKDGTLRPVEREARDTNIAVVGGIWEDNCTNRRGYGASGLFNTEARRVGNFYGVSTLFFFGNADHVTVRDAVFRRCGGFAVQAGNGDAHVYENICFDRCYADGLHLNGNLTRVRARNVRGSVGDDLVALNAYDWLNSSVTFGPQRWILCEDLELLPRFDGKFQYPAIRILPASFRYADGSVVDCSVSDVIFRRVKGIRTFKMYLQTPRYEVGTEPEWSRIGSGGNLFFEKIAIDLAGPIDEICQYAASEPVRGHFGAFEFGANLSSVTLRDIDITFRADRWPLCHLATVGPKSALLEEKGRRFEIFDPYASCRVGRVTVENVTVRGVVPRELVHRTAFDDVNGDGRSTGRGEIVRLDLPESRK